MSVLGFLGDYAKNHTGAGRMIGKYQRYHQQQGPPPPSYMAGHLAQAPPGVLASDPNANSDPYDMASPDMSQSDATGGQQEQGMAGDDTTLGPEAMAGGKLVTKPTLARLGESGPEMVVPLNGKPGNHTSPALLEGQVPTMQPTGVHYQRYKHFTNRAY